MKCRSDTGFHTIKLHKEKLNCSIQYHSTVVVLSTRAWAVSTSLLFIILFDPKTLSINYRLLWWASTSLFSVMKSLGVIVEGAHGDGGHHPAALSQPHFKGS